MSEDASTRGRLRVSMLLQQGRFADAEQACREVLAQDPDDSLMTYLLALSQYRQDGGEPRALPTVDRAIALEPGSATSHALRARILTEMDRLDDALTSAETAVRLDPDDTDGHTARGFVRFRRQDWPGAEQSARDALAIDPEDLAAAHLLTESLRIQGRASENLEVLEERLARDPLEPNAHVSLGWRALQADQRDDAERHFLEALRLDPGHDAARAGLLEAFKSRAPWYRAWLRLNLWAQRFSRTSRWAVMIGLYLALRFSRVVFTGALAPVGYVLTALWLLLALWSHLASGSANFIVLLDSRARHALRRRERLEAVAVGGCLLLGLFMTLAAAVPGSGPVPLAGLLVFGASIPFAYTFTNDSVAGSRLFGGIAGFTLLAAALVLLSGFAPSVVPPSFATLPIGIAALGVIATTWISSIPALRK